MSDFRGNRSEGLGKAVGKGDYANPVDIPTKLTGAQWIGNIALSATAVGVGLASATVLGGAEAARDLAKSSIKNMKSKVLGAIPHDIEAGKYLD